MAEGTPMAESSGGTRQLDIEWVAIKAGIKPANRITISPEHADRLAERARREGFAVERGARMVEFPGRPPSLILYLAPDPVRARELVAAEAPLLPPESNRLDVDQAVPLHTHLGALLGFPDCCVAEFGNRLRRGITTRAVGGNAHEDFVAAECASRASEVFLGRLNDLAPDRRARLVTFYPCRYDCSVAARYAADLFKAAERTNATAAATLQAQLLGTMTIASNGERGPSPRRGEGTLTLEFSRF